MQPLAETLGSKLTGPGDSYFSMTSTYIPLGKALLGQGQSVLWAKGPEGARRDQKGPEEGSGFRPIWDEY